MVLTLTQQRQFRWKFGSPASELFLNALLWSKGCAAQQSNLIEWMAPSAATLSRTACGSRLVQEALNLTELQDSQQQGFRQSSELDKACCSARRELLHNLLSSGTVVLELARCKHGNHVLQCVAKNATADEIVRLVEFLREEVLVHACHKSEVGGGKRSVAQTPTGNPSPAPTLTPRTHDTTDQWRETIRPYSPKFNEKCSVVADASKRMCPI